MMKDHFGFSDSEYQNLAKAGVTDQDLFKTVPLFDPDGHGCELNRISLMLYVDRKGNFNAPPKKLKHKLIAKAMFNSLPVPEKLEILKYIEAAEDGEF